MATAPVPETAPLIRAVEAADAQAGRTVVKPAGQPSRECFAIPAELWEKVRLALEVAKRATPSRAEPSLHYIETQALDKLRAVSKRLYTENRLSGDDMRNLAQALDAVLACTFPTDL